jgi:hypothetical protein
MALDALLTHCRLGDGRLVDIGIADGRMQPSARTRRHGVVKLNNCRGKSGRDRRLDEPRIFAQPATLPGANNVNLTKRRRGMSTRWSRRGPISEPAGAFQRVVDFGYQQLRGVTGAQEGLMCRTRYGVADLDLDRGDPIGLVHRILALWSEAAHAHRRRANESHCATAIILVILLRTRERVLAPLR